MQSSVTPVLILDLIGIAVGLIAILQILAIRKTLAGKLGDALNLFVCGVAAQILAFGWTVVFVRLKLLPSPTIDLHHLLMAIGIVFFLLAAKRFASLAKF